MLPYPSGSWMEAEREGEKISRKITGNADLKSKLCINLIAKKSEFVCQEVHLVYGLEQQKILIAIKIDFFLIILK